MKYFNDFETTLINQETLQYYREYLDFLGDLDISTYSKDETQKFKSQLEDLCEEYTIAQEMYWSLCN